MINSSNSENGVRLYVDFDGTITVRDVGDDIFLNFINPELIKKGWFEDLIERWKAGEISSIECLELECANTVMTSSELDEILERHELTPGFPEIVAFCREKNIPVTILSDGLDYYIEFILKKFGLADVPFRSNSLVFGTNGTVTVEFPYGDKGCGLCGNCKRWHIDKNGEKSDYIIYIGDGYSDRFAIRSSDFVFAKGDLAKYCGIHNIPFIEFEDFHDILLHLDKEPWKLS